MLSINISNETLFKEFRSIQTLDLGYSSGNYWNEIVLYFQWQEFYKHELQMWRDNKIIKGLPLRSYIYANRKKYINKGYSELTGREILRAFKICGIHVGNSFHSPFWIKQFIKDYNIHSIYDPCGGWGHRLLGGSNIKYIYNDINSQTYNNCMKLCNFFNLTDKYFYNNDCAKFTPDQCYEAVFTCPPYFNIEKYTDIGAENKSYSEFIEWWKQTVLYATNKPTCKYFAFVINSTYEEALCNVLYELNFKLLQRCILGSTNQVSHFNKHTTKKYEIINIFECY